MSTVYIKAPSGRRGRVLRNKLRVFDEDTLLVEVDAQRKAKIEECQAGQADIAYWLPRCQNIQTWIEEGFSVYNWYKAESGRDKKWQSLTTDDIHELIKKKNYKSPF